MKSAKLLLVFFLLSQLCNAQDAIEKLNSNNFSVHIQHYTGAFSYASGLRYKIGMSDQIDNNPTWNYFNLGTIEGKETTSRDFNVTNLLHKKKNNEQDIIVATLQHRVLPLVALVTFTAYHNTGVMVSRVEYRNTSKSNPIRITNAPSVAMGLPNSDYEYAYLTCGWANERKMQTHQLEKDTFNIRSTTGRSSTDYSPWFSIHDKTNNIYYNAQLAWSGNWWLDFHRDQQLNVQFAMGEYFDHNQYTLLKGESLQTAPIAFTAAYGPIDEAANNLHRYQRQFVMKTSPTNNPMLVQFNTWFPLQIDINAENLKPYIQQAADLGLEVFTIDAGWYVHKSFEHEVGNWQTNKQKFPNGLGETANYVRSKGMKFGLWFEIESLGIESNILKQHPEWCLQHNGQPAICIPWSNRRHLDFSNPDAFEWALTQFGKMYDECGGIDWVKLDYNVSIGSNFENEEGIAKGNALRNHVLGFYRWLDALNQKYPNLVLENCSSGALRMDLGILEHTHTSFVSDETSANPSLGMAWSSTLEYTPRMINHWTVGMGNHNPIIDNTLHKGYWDYMFRVPMNGQFGISSRIVDWTPELKACAKENIKLYKKIRTIIADADVYHLTPQPDYTDPQGWTALLYVGNEAKQAVAMVNRCRGGANDYQLKPQKLNPQLNYKVEIDGKPYANLSGASLLKDGLNLKLDNYRSTVIAFYAK